MARTKTIKEDSRNGSAYLYHYEGWNIEIKKNSDPDEKDALLIMINKPAEESVVFPQVAYSDGKLMFHFDKGNVYTTEQIKVLSDALSDLLKVEETLQKKWFSAQK